VSESHFFLRPVLGRLVRDPQQNMAQLPAAGARKPRTSFWIRRIRSGDVVEVKPLAKKTEVTSG